MDAIDRRLRERLHRAGAEISVLPLAPGRALGEPRVGGGRTLRPLLAAVALAVVVAGVAGGVGLHARFGARQPAPAAPPAAPSTPKPSLDAGSGAAPGFHQVSAVWDSTDKQILAYDWNSMSGIGTVWTWQGAWVQRQQPSSSGLGGEGFVIDAPGLHGVAFLGTTFQLWKNGTITPMPAPAAPECMDPLQGTWDFRGNQLVVIFTDQCTGGTAPKPAETWTYDGRVWLRHSDVPAVRWPVLASSPSATAVTLLGSLNGDFAQAWTWNGTGWTRGPASRFSFPSPPGGAGWDARTGAVVVWAPADAGGPARAQQYSAGVFKELLQQGQPERTEGGVIADTTHGRLLVIGQDAIPAWATAAASHQLDDYHVLEWTGSTWVPITYAELSASN